MGFPKSDIYNTFIDFTFFANNDFNMDYFQAYYKISLILAVDFQGLNVIPPLVFQVIEFNPTLAELLPLDQHRIKTPPLLDHLD
jgi:hypothetical protein